MPSWHWVASTFSQRTAATAVQIRRGKRFQFRVGHRPWSRGWWCLTLSHLQKAVLAAASATFTMLSDLVLELDGMSIGGSLSSSAVGARFAYEESKAFRSAKHLAAGFGHLTSADIDWLRYVDDILACSQTVCSQCMSLFFKLLFEEPVSDVYKSCQDFPQPCIWLNFACCIHGNSLKWTLKNTNRQYLYGNRLSPFVPAFLPWPGALPYHFRQLRGMLISKLAMCWAASIDVVLSSFVLIEMLLELLRLGYPLSLARALIHSVPRYPAALLARQAIRALQALTFPCQAGCSMGKGGESKGNQQKRPSSGGNNFDRRGN